MSTQTSQSNEWIQLQINVFSRWVQNQLKDQTNVHVDKITKDLSDGVALVELAKKLTQKDTPRNWSISPKRTVEMVQNCDLAVDMFTKDGVNLVGISGKDVNDNNEKLILGLIWSLILHYSIGKSIHTQSVKNNDSTEEKAIKNETKVLKSWAIERTENYPNIHNFMPYELSMCALLDSYVPERINYYSLDPKDTDHNATLATTVMNDLGIPILIYPEDVKNNDSRIDDKTLLTQLSTMKSVLEEQELNKVTSRNEEILEEKTDDESDDEEIVPDTDDFANTLIEDNEIEQESMIKFDSANQSVENGNDNDFVDDFANTLFEDNEIEQESMIKFDSANQSVENGNDNDLVDDFENTLFEDNEIEQESMIKFDSANQFIERSAIAQFSEDFTNAIFEDNEIEQDSMIKNESANQRDEQQDNHPIKDEFSINLFRNGSQDKEDLFQPQPDFVKKSVDQIATPLLEDNLLEDDSLKVDSKNEKKRSSKRKYHKLHQKHDDSFFDYLFNNVLMPYETIYNTQGNSIYPYGRVMMLNSPITPFYYYVDYSRHFINRYLK